VRGVGLLAPCLYVVAGFVAWFHAPRVRGMLARLLPGLVSPPE
jgi:hypothetical protein